MMVLIEMERRERDGKVRGQQIFVLCVLTKEGLVSWQLFDGSGEYTTECLCMCVPVCLVCMYTDSSPARIGRKTRRC
ncbi:hypothetical protein V8C44DRAFT_344259 [Trichoderma aethiopicum]